MTNTDTYNYKIIFNPETRLGDSTSKADSVHDAIMWCDREFGHGQWDMSNQFPSWRWEFSFSQPEHATHFALRWII